jgi:hypothetical protein
VYEAFLIIYENRESLTALNVIPLFSTLLEKRYTKSILQRMNLIVLDPLKI